MVDLDQKLCPQSSGQSSIPQKHGILWQNDLSTDFVQSQKTWKHRMKMNLAKIVCGIFLLCFSKISVFAQEDLQNAVFINPSPLFLGLVFGGIGIGVGYERGITDNFSAMANVGYAHGERDGTTLTMVSSEIHGRYYPLGGSVKGWFVDGFCGYTYFDNPSFDNTDAWHIFQAGVLTGWKFIPKADDNIGAFGELGVGYVFLLGKIGESGSTTLPDSSFMAQLFGFPSTGMVLRFCAGWAF